jgi:hypothetical protein
MTGQQSGVQGRSPGYPAFSGYSPYTSPSLPPQTVSPLPPVQSSGASVSRFSMAFLTIQ